MADPAIAIAALMPGDVWDGGGLDYVTAGIVVPCGCQILNANISSLAVGATEQITSATIATCTNSAPTTLASLNGTTNLTVAGAGGFAPGGGSFTALTTGGPLGSFTFTSASSSILFDVTWVSGGSGSLGTGEILIESRLSIGATDFSSVGIATVGQAITINGAKDNGWKIINGNYTVATYSTTLITVAYTGGSPGTAYTPNDAHVAATVAPVILVKDIYPGAPGIAGSGDPVILGDPTGATELFLEGSYPNDGQFHPDQVAQYGISIRGCVGVYGHYIHTKDTYGDGIDVFISDGSNVVSSDIQFDHVLIENTGREGMTLADIDDHIATNFFAQFTIRNALQNALSNESDSNDVGCGGCVFDDFTFDGGGFNIISYLAGDMIFNNIQGQGRINLLDGFAVHTIRFNAGTWTMPATGGTLPAIAMAGGNIFWNGTAIPRTPPGAPNSPPVDMWAVVDTSNNDKVAATNGNIADVSAITSTLGIHDYNSLPFATVAAGSNGGDITNIATWGSSFGGNGVLCITGANADQYYTTGGHAYVQTALGTAIVEFAAFDPGLSELTGCQIIEISNPGVNTVSTGDQVGGILNCPLDPLGNTISISSGSNIITATSGTFTSLHLNRQVQVTSLPPCTVTQIIDPHHAFISTNSNKTASGLAASFQGTANFAYLGASGTHPSNNELTGASYILNGLVPAIPLSTLSSPSSLGSIADDGPLHHRGLLVGGTLSFTTDSDWTPPPGATPIGLSKVILNAPPGGGPPPSTPTVTGVSPNTAPPGQIITITGTNLSGISGISFGGTPATLLAGGTSTSITVAAPAGTGTVDVTVTTTLGTSPTSAADHFTFGTGPPPPPPPPPGTSPTPILVTARYANPNGTEILGSITFEPTERFSYPDWGAVSGSGTVPLVNGQLVVVLWANDDAETTPKGTGYIVTENLGNQPSIRYVVMIPSGASGATVDLSRLPHLPVG